MQKLVLLVLFCSVCSAFGQLSLEDYNRRMYNYNKGGWIVVGAWSVVGVGVGGYGIAHPKNLQNKYFQEMNVMANMANLCFAIPGYISAMRKDPASFNEKDTYRHNVRHENTYLFNAGLDIFYTVTGLRLRQLGQTNKNHPEILTGFGNSLIVQGGFLLCTDLTMTILHNIHRRRKFDNNVEFSTGPNGIGFKWKL